jgi:hypothetical protein
MVQIPLQPVVTYILMAQDTLKGTNSHRESASHRCDGKSVSLSRHDEGTLKPMSDGNNVSAVFSNAFAPICGACVT